MQVTGYAETEVSKPDNEQSIELYKLITNPWQQAMHRGYQKEPGRKWRPTCELSEL